MDIEIDLGTGGDRFQLQARMAISLPGLTEENAKKVIKAAHQTCPYSKATRGIST
jgi:osmotically inducible protein OsmC